jgi:hypothetical protein
MTTLPAAVPHMAFATSAPRERAIMKTVARSVTAARSQAVARPLPPRRLVDVSRVGVTNMPAKFLDRSLQLGGALTLQPGDHPQRDRQAKQVEHQLLDRPLAEAIGPGADAEDRPQTGATRSGGNPRRQGPAGADAATGTGQAVKSILVHHGKYWWQFCNLVAERLGVITLEVAAAPSAMGRLAHHELTDLFRRNQDTDTTVMTGLSSPLLSRLGNRRPSLHRWGIRGRWPGRVGGVAVEPFLERGDPLLMNSHWRAASPSAGMSERVEPKPPPM